MPGRAPAITWVVYELAARRQSCGGRGVCEQSEWDAMQLEWPGRLTLLLAGIASEAEAEKLARGDAGDRGPRLRLRL